MTKQATRTKFNMGAIMAGQRVRVALFGALILCATGCGSGNAPSNDAASLSVTADPNSASSTDRAIATAQKAVVANSKDTDARLALAQAFLQKAREVADPSLYTRADGLLKDLRKQKPEDPNVLITSGSLALSKHDFEDALGYGNKALKYSPKNAEAYGVLVDANNELGHYDAALDATQSMVDIKPDIASYSRVSYARELRGDLPGAIEAMRQAITASGGSGENVAYVTALLGDLLLKSGQPRDADAQYTAAEKDFPGFGTAKAGHANVLTALGHPEQGVKLWADVVNVQPLATYVQFQGDALATAGDEAGSKNAYDLVDVINKLYAANGVQVDLESALFEASTLR